MVTPLSYEVSLKNILIRSALACQVDFGGMCGPSNTSTAVSLGKQFLGPAPGRFHRDENIRFSQE